MEGYPAGTEGRQVPRTRRDSRTRRWLLAVPRAIELVFLGLAFVLLSIVGFFAGLFRRKPRDPVQYRPHQWTARRVVRVMCGFLFVIVGLGVLPVGAVGLWLDQTGRDNGGFIGTDLKRFSSTGHAITTEPGALRFDGPPWLMNKVLGELRVTGVSATGIPLFLGIATTRETTTYLAPVEHTVIHRLDQNYPEPVSDERTGDAPAQQPGSEWFWVAQASGEGLQAVEWRPRPGNWSVVVMNADGEQGIEVDLAVAATLPWLDDLAFSLIGLGVLGLLVGTLFITLTLRAVRRDRAAVG